MFYISDFCHICFKYENSLINLGQKEAANAEIVDKLMLCVSEVEWAVNKNFCMCDICLQRLNSAYDFKQQCIKSIETLSKYLLELDSNTSLTKEDICKELLNKFSEGSQQKPAAAATQNASQSQQATTPTDQSTQKLLAPLTKLIVTNSGPAPLQNFYLNLIPTSMININNLTSPGFKDGGTQNMLLLGSTMAFPPLQPKAHINNNMETTDINVVQLLENSKSEELSIEADPTVFECMSECESDNEKDCDDLISCNKINYPPILSKINGFSEVTNEEKMEFFNFGHFLTNPRMKSYNMNMQCDICSQCFDTIRSLRNHIKSVHEGNFPYKCSFCLADFALRNHYESHMEKHNSDSLLGNSITLDNIKQHSSESFIHAENYECQTSGSSGKEYKCDLCGRRFTTSQGLIRHKVRRHEEQKVRTKYFVKGMKNAKCDICNRSFSTQSYLQLHLKLHNRKGEWKRKIYKKDDEAAKSEEPQQQEEDEKHQDEPKPPPPEDDKENQVIDDVIDDQQPLDEIVEDEIPTAEENRTSIKIKINLKDIIRVQEEVEEVEEAEEECQQIQEEAAESAAGDKSEIDEYNVAEHFRFTNFDDLSIHDESKLDTICFTEDSVPLQNQNVFKFEWVNGKPKCVYCQKMFGRKHDLKRHINNVHMKSIQYKCHICKRKFYEGFHLTRHLRGHYSSLACPQCNKKFCTITDIKNHLMVSHDGMGNVDCGVCNISFDDLLILKDHIEEHLKTIIYKCHICSEEYKECRDLTKHIVEHSGVYTCNQCNRNFCTEKELLSHMRIHSSEVSMRHKCEICQNTFKKKRYLYSHLKNCHSIEKQDAEILIDTVLCEYSDHL